MNLNKTFVAVQDASRNMLALSDKEINQILLAVADAAINKTDFILSENQKDLERMPSTDPKYDRLKLTKSRLQDIATDIRNVAALPSPLGKVLKENVLPNGLKIKRVSVPFGVIGIIYEARPNVSFDVFSLCLKSGNACILKGGSDADYSNRAIISVIHEVLEHFNVDTHIVELLPADREATAELLHANDYVDLIIPRGSSSLINFVRQNATVPVIETGAGVCHAFFDRYGDISIGPSIIANAKTRRVSVCNALDCLIIEADSLADLPDLCLPLQSSNVEIFADEPAYHSLHGKYPAELLRPATEDCYGREFLDYKMAIKTVNSFQEALAHIRKYGSKHSECIITDDKTRAEWFCREVDAACVYVNAPTSFTDGAQFGLGAEIGISTQKAALNLGMNVIVLDINQGAWKLETERGVIMDGDKPEHLLEAIPVMGCYCDVIGVRSFARFESKEDDYNEVILEQFIKHSGRPVFSMEAATRHPLQSFADLITIEEYKKTERPKVVMTWAPHPRPLPQAVPNSFAEWMNATDYDFVITHPEGYELDPKFVGNARVEYDQMKAFEGADFVYAKNWAAYTGDNYGQILSKDRAWTVGERQMAVTNNAYFMHCLPVRRNMIVTDDVIESPQSIVIPEAANREISATVVLKRLLESL